MSAIHVGVDRFLHLGEGSRFFDIVLACGGAIKLHIHVIRHPDRLFQAISAISSRQIACLAIDIQAQSLSFLAKPTSAGWSEGTFQRVFRPTSRPKVLEVASKVKRSRNWRPPEDSMWLPSASQMSWSRRPSIETLRCCTTSKQNCQFSRSHLDGIPSTSGPLAGNRRMQSGA
jgi:hypothetical protein